MKSQLLFVTLIALSLLIAPAFALPQVAGKPNADKQDPPSSANPRTNEPSKDSDEDLRRAIQSSGGSETQIVANLEGYLKKYPNSDHRDGIERELYSLSVKMRDRNRAINYAEKLVTRDESNIEALTSLVTMLRERKTGDDLNKALAYADDLIKRFENLISTRLKPKRISSAQWQDSKEQGIASVYLLRGKVQADLGAYDKSRADLMKSYKSARLADTAVALGELSEKRRNIDEAIEYYLQGFAISLNTEEKIDQKSLRRKIGQLYSTKNGSEVGLGDRLLKAQDAYLKEREERLAKLDPPNINSGVGDPLKFTLTKIDGSPLKLDDHRGKVIVMNFWATWCGPCLTEMPLFEKTIAKYKNDKNVVFLAITTDEDRELVAPFLKQYKFNLPVAYAEYLNDHFGVSSIPTTIILDPKGEIAFRQAGFNPREDFVEALSEKIEDAKKR
ncbi:MAG TPA: TlpA disulfide reductase family protein [Blastocatellia bacterium]|nr:TlpA disulfide reductase family protein [Blastocatellia bacterium]